MTTDARKDRKHIKVFHDFFDRWKVQLLSPAAICALIECTIECSKELSDGVMSVRKFNRTVPSKRIRDALVCSPKCSTLFDVCPHVATLSADKASVIFTDYLDDQTSRAKVEAISETRSSAGRKGGRPRKQNGSVGENQIGKQTETKTEPRYRDRYRDRGVGEETVSPTATKTDQSQTPPPPSPFCERHPGGTDRACFACKQARRAFEATEPVARTGPVKIDRASIERCAFCDDNGFVITLDDGPVRRCDHRDAGHG